jgi:hypothetical protein
MPSFWRRQLIAVLFGLGIVLVSSVPTFDINLNEPPEQRWLGVASYYQKELVSMLDKLIPIMTNTYQDKEDSWVNDVEFDPEYEAELQGMVDAIGHPSVILGRLKWLNMLYEMDSPYASACSGVLWASPDGSVTQGRNMDDFSVEEASRMVDWSAITFDANIYRGGQLLMRITQWPGSVGIHTGMRYSQQGFGGWGFAQNTRKPNAWQDNLAAADKGGQIFGLTVRRIMEATPDYATAMTELYRAKFMAPQYFIISGSGSFEGAVLTIDRLGKHFADTPSIQRVSNSSGNWHLVQTNDDLLSEAEDPRRPLANYLLRSSRRDITLHERNMLQFMHTTMLLNSGTVFTTVMVPETAYYKTILPSEPPEMVDGSAVSQNIMMGSGLALNQAYEDQRDDEGAGEDDEGDEGHEIKGSGADAWNEPDRMNAKGGAPLSLQQEPAPAPKSKRRFLAPHGHRRLERRGHAPIASALQSISDEVSFMQTSWKLET